MLPTTHDSEWKIVNPIALQAFASPPKFRPENMEPWQAFLLGLIEGITEFLPVSSTGHLLVAQQIMGIGTDSHQAKVASDTFAICIQGGAILAVLGLYFKRVMRMVMGVCGKDPEGLKLAISVIVGFLPAAVIGVLLNDWIEQKLFGIWPVIAAWVVGGLMILLISPRAKRDSNVGSGVELLEITWKMALMIGLLQCVAMWPGTSRSLMTIVGGVLVGLSLRAAVEYSFLLGVVTLTAATAKKAVWKVPGIDAQYDVWFGGAQLMWDSYGPIALAVGVVSATVSAALAVKWLVSYLQKHGLEIFGWYRIALGVVVGGLVLAGFIS